MIWASAAVIISGTWAFVASKVLEAFLVKQRSVEISALAAKLELVVREQELLGGEVSRIKDRMITIGLKK